MEKKDKLVIFNDSFLTLRSRGIVKTWGDFANILGVSKNSISAAKNGNEVYLTENLISKISSLMKQYDSASDTSSTYRENTPTRTLHGELQLVPTIPYKLYQEENINLMEYIRENVVPMGPAIAQFAQTDLHMFVSNDEMKPHLRAGDVLSLKMVPKDATIINGEIYVINTTNIGIIIRYVYDRGDYLELKSSNEWYEPFQLKKTNVYTIFKILGLVRTNI